MTINEAITHAETKAKELRLLSCANHEEIKSCLECAREHEELAMMLKELRVYREIGTIEELEKNKMAVYEIKKLVRNPHFIAGYGEMIRGIDLEIELGMIPPLKEKPCRNS